MTHFGGIGFTDFNHVESGFVVVGGSSILVGLYEDV